MVDQLSDRFFEIEAGWGEEWYIAYSTDGRQSTPYRAVNHSTAYDKALMLKPEDIKISRVEFNKKIVWPT